MGLETGTYISDLIATNPVGATDDRATADDHLRLIKAVLQNTFPTANSAINISAFIKTLLDDANAAAARATLLVKDPIFMGQIREGPTFNTTYYVGPTGEQTGTDADAYVRSILPVAGILYNLYVKVAINSANYDLVVTLRKNNVDTAMTVTVPAGTTTVVSDTSNTVSVDAGDYISVKLASGAGSTGSLVNVSWGFLLKGS